MLVQSLCITLVSLGACVMSYSIYKYYKSLSDLKTQMNAKNLFGEWIYAACFAMMIFFLIGYVFCGVAYAIKTLMSMDDLLISLIFFFGAIFVFAMGTMMRRMFTTLKDNTELVVAKEMAERSGQAKSAFLANMSHEIRTPMNSILGFTELALDDNISVQTREYLGRIHNNTEMLLHIVNDILDISKVESGKIELEKIPFDLNGVFRRCQSAILPGVNAKQLDLQVYIEPCTGKQLIGDPVRLYQALLNILSNAVKFTKTGTVKFSSLIKNADEHTTTVYFEVKDSGIGMTPGQIEKIFEPFMQADVSTTRKYGGTGLGLSISKNIVELMGGKLIVESTPGIGSIFSFELEFETIDMQDSGSDITENFTVDKPHFNGLVLICDDNEMNRQLICEHLARVGLKTVTAENGKIGLEMVQERLRTGLKPFDLIFMDSFMPVMDGVEAVSRINALGTTTPVVAMTANVMSGEFEKYKKSGFSDCLGKPYTTRELWRCLLKYLKPVGSSVDDEQDQAGDNNFLDRMLKINFIKTNQDKFEEIKKAIEHNDLKLAHRLVHNLKCNAGMIGEAELQNAAARAESLLRDGDPSVSLQLGALEFKLKQVLEKLRPMQEEAAISPVSGDADADKVLTLFEKLKPMLENINPECINLLNDIRSIPGTGELVRHLENYEFEEGARTLAEMEREWLNYGK